MNTESQVIEADCRLWTDWMAICILSPYDGRVEEDSSADGVAREAEDIQGRKIRCEALRSFPLDVQDDLRIE